MLPEVFFVLFPAKLERAAFVALLILLTALAGTAFAVRDHEIQAEDYFDLTVLGNLSVSPDGKTAAYTESRWGRGKEGRATDLWAVDLDGDTLRRLTFDGFGGQSPVFTPDGEFIYCLGRVDQGQDAPPFDGSRQVWRLEAEDGEPQAVTRHTGGVSDFELSPDALSLYYSVTEEETSGDWQDLRNKYKDLEYGHGVIDLNALRRLDLRTWRDEEVFPARRVFNDMALSPDGTRLALITTEDNELIFREGWSRVDILDLATGEVTEVTSQQWRADHPSPYGWIEDICWSGDSRAVAFSISYDGFASHIWTAEEADDWALTRITRPDLVTYAGGLQWLGAGRTLSFRGETMARVKVYGIDGIKTGQQGKTRVLVNGDGVIAAAAWDAKGKTAAVIYETITRTNDVYAVKGADKLVPITHVNPQVETWILPQIEHVSWTGADGDVCYGILELPPGYQKGDGPLPTIIELHGGPTASSQYRLRLWIYGRALMASKGYALLSPNYHGSTGYGDEFLEKLIGRENEVEVKDIANGTRWLIEEGLADPAKIGVMGWSNGGYLTNCMIVAEPDMFAAASSGAGVLDMVIQWGIEDTPGHVINFVQGLPWEQPEHYQHASPLYHLDRVKTPTLIHVGGNDPRVPPAHSRALYRGLKHYLNVPVELVVYPGEPHGLTTHENRLAKITWDLAWFDKYLLGKE